MNLNVPTRFDEDFFKVHEAFERVPSEDYSTVPFTEKLQYNQCVICNKKFSFFSSAKTCPTCSILYCGDCMKKKGNVDICSCCKAIETNPVTFADLKTLDEYRSNYYQQKHAGYSPRQTAVLVLLDMLKRKEDRLLHEYSICSLYSNRRHFVNDPVISSIVQSSLFKFLNDSHECPKLCMLLDLFCDLSIINKGGLKPLNIKYENIRPFLNPKNSAVSAAAARLILVLSLEKIVNPDQKASVEILGLGNKRAIAFIMASLASTFTEPPLFEDSISSPAQFNENHIPKIVQNVLRVYEKKPISSTASQYFGSLILLKISETEIGAKSLTKYLPLKQLITSVLMLCPRTLGIIKHEGRIAVYLARTLKNIWFFCEKSPDRDTLLSSFYADLTNFIFDITESRPGFDRYSYLCIVQSIAIELADDIQMQEKYKIMLASQQFQDKIKQMKEERRTATEKENQKKIDFLNTQTHQMEQLTQEQVLQIRERERENGRIRTELQELRAKLVQKDNEIAHIRKSYEDVRVAANNKLLQATNAIKQRDLTIKSLNTKISEQFSEISNIKEIVSAKEVEISNIRSTNDSSSVNAQLLASKETEINSHKRIAEEKAKLLDQKQKEIDDLSREIAVKDEVKQHEIDEIQKQLDVLKSQIDERQKVIEARDSEILRIQSVLKGKEDEIIQKDSLINNQREMSSKELVQLHEQIDQSKKEAEIEINKLKTEIQSKDQQIEAIKSVSDANSISAAAITVKDAEISSLKQQIESQAQEIAQKSQEITQKSQELAQKSEEVSQKSQELDNRISVASQNEENLKKEIESKDSIINQLKQSVEAEGNSAALTAASLAEKDGEIQNLKQQIESKSAEIESKSKELEEKIRSSSETEVKLREEIASKDSIIDQLKQSAQESGNSSAAQAALIAEKDSEILNYKQQLEAKSTDVTNKDSQINELEQKVQSAQSELNEKSTELTNKETLIADLEKKLQDAQTEITNKDATIDTLKKSSEENGSSAASTIALKDEEIASKVKEIASKDEEIASIKKEIEEKAAALQEAQQQIEQKNQEVESKENLIVQLKQSALESGSSSATVIAEKENEINSLKSQLDEKSSDISAKDGKISELEQSLQSAQSEISTRDAQIEELKKSSSDLVSSKDEDIAAANQTIDTKENQISSLKQQLEEKQQIVETKESEISDKNSVINDMATDNQKKEEEITNLKNEVELKDKELHAISNKFASLMEQWSKAAEVITKEEPDLDFEAITQIPPE